MYLFDTKKYFRDPKKEGTILIEVKINEKIINPTYLTYKYVPDSGLGTI